MDEALAIFRATHILAGFLGLAAFWIPILTKKGRPVHMAAGRLFAACALYVGSTGLAWSIWAVANPPSFFGDPRATQIPPEAVPAAVANARFLYSITGFLGISILAGTLMGWRAARSNPGRSSRVAVLTVLATHGMWSIGLIAFGAWNLIAAQSDQHPLSGSGGRYAASAIIGAIGLWGIRDDLAFVRRPPADRHDRISKHMECMLGAGIGFHAAALFFGVNGLLGLNLDGAMRFAPLIVPFLVGMPIVWWAVSRREQDRGDADGA